MKPRTILVCFLCLLPAFLPAQLIDINASRSADQLRWGVQAFHRGFFNDSWVALEKAITFQPANTLATMWLGRAQWKAGYEEDALKTWQRLVDTGRGTAVVRDWIKVIGLRRGLGRELAGSPPWVVSSELDGTLLSGHPFKRPTSVRPRPDGTFWVVAFGSNEVLRYDANFRLMDSLHGGLEGFDRPYDVLEADDGSLYVSEYGANRIAKCNPRGDKIKTFGRKGRADGLLLGPQYLVADGRGYMWVTDWGNSRVVRFDMDGNFVQSISGIAGPTGIAVHEDKLFVSEKSNKRVLMYELNGNPISSIGEGTLQEPEGLAFTPDGHLLVADGNRIMECDIERETWSVRGDTSASTGRLVQQSVGPNGDILGVDFDQSKIVLLNSVSALYSGLVVRVDRINSLKFPEVYVDVSVENRLGKSIVGLTSDNFVVTEMRSPVSAPTVALANTSVRTSDVSLLVERSPALETYRSEVEQSVGDLYGLVTKEGRIKALSAAEKPLREADFGETRLRFIRQSLQTPPSAKWRFDIAAKAAGDELITAVSGARRAIVFMTSGTLGPGAFTTYSLTEVAAYMRNSGIAFYPVLFGSQPPDEDLSFLASETGGSLFSASSPGGMLQVMHQISARVGPLYTLHFISNTAPEFGEKYIPLEVEVTVQKVSGRDESGYYAPQ